VSGVAAESPLPPSCPGFDPPFERAGTRDRVFSNPEGTGDVRKEKDDPTPRWVLQGGDEEVMDVDHLWAVWLWAGVAHGHATEVMERRKT